MGGVTPLTIPLTIPLTSYSPPPLSLPAPRVAPPRGGWARGAAATREARTHLLWKETSVVAVAFAVFVRISVFWGALCHPGRGRRHVWVRATIYLKLNGSLDDVRCVTTGNSDQGIKCFNLNTDPHMTYLKYVGYKWVSPFPPDSTNSINTTMPSSLPPFPSSPLLFTL